MFYYHFCQLACFNITFYSNNIIIVAAVHGKGGTNQVLPICTEAFRQYHPPSYICRSTNQLYDFFYSFYTHYFLIYGTLTCIFQQTCVWRKYIQRLKRIHIIIITTTNKIYRKIWLTKNRRYVNAKRYVAPNSCGYQHPRRVRLCVFKY